jgi:hydrogenase/urease accessory protein HupE
MTRVGITYIMKWTAIFIWFLAAAPSAFAHPEGFSGLRFVISPDRTTARAILTLHTRDLSRWFPPGKFPDYVADVSHGLESQPQELIDLRADGQLLTPAKTHAFSADTGLIETDIDYALPAGTTHLEVWSKHLVMLPRGHQQLLIAESDGKTLAEQTLTSEEDAASIDLPPPGAVAATTAPSSQPTRRISFFALGVEHIVTGYDHLLFLAALLLVCKNLREAAAVITFFTIAHSITLSLAALDIVRLPGRIVEPAIAASIVYVGLENIFGRHRFIWRALVTFAFGLVHGLGFASALREVGLGSSSMGIAMPLLKFSIGLETGQLCIAAVFLRLLLTLRRREGYETYLVPACSVLVSLLGGYWLVTRVLAG